MDEKRIQENSKGVTLSVVICETSHIHDSKQIKFIQDSVLFLTQDYEGNFFEVYHIAKKKKAFTKHPLFYYIGSKLSPLFIGDLENKHVFL